MVEDEDIDIAELLAEVRRIEVQSRRLVTGVMAGGYSSVFRGAGIEFSEVREYVDGDDPRSVDWNVTARLGRPFVKKFVDERQLTVIFLLDLSASMAGGFSRWSIRRCAAGLCGLIALAAIRNNDKVGLAGFSSGLDFWVPPKRASGQVLHILRDCLVRRGSGPGSRPGPALEYVARVAPRHSVVFLVSDFLTGGYDDELLRCSLRHDLVALRILPPELEPPRARWLRLRDPESGREGLVDWGDPRTRESYRQRVAAWRAETEASMARAKVDLVDVVLPREPGRDTITRPILSFFRMREERGARR